MSNKRKYIWGALAATALAVFWSTRRHRNLSKQLSPAEVRFIKRATTLEAQQVPLYCLLARKAESRGDLRLQVGLEKAMEVEARHLRDLQWEGKRFAVKLGLWEKLGNVLGRLSGTVLAALAPQAGLWVISKIEAVAAGEYAKARSQVCDQELQQLYLVNQVDEETHQAWAVKMLEDLHQEESRQTEC